MRVLSRSAYEASLQCQRRYFYQFLYARTGLEEAVKPIHLAFGLALHKGMEVSLRMPDDLDTEDYAAKGIVAALGEWGRYARGHEAMDAEVRALLTALITGWWETQSERFFSEWEVVSVEEEGVPIALAPGVGLAFRVDVAVRNKYDSALAVVNWKSTSSSWGFAEQFESDIQTWTEAECLERTLGEPVVGCVMEGFVKGQLKDGHFSSALIRPWRTVRPDGTKAYSWDWKTVEADRKKTGSQWARINAWEETFPTGASGVAGWLSWMPPEAVASHFCSTGFLKRPPRRVMEGWLRQMSRRAQDEEHLLAEGVALADQENYFHQHFSKWTCGSEAAPRCPFRPVCFGQATLGELVQGGVLEEREDHHAQPIL
jgi:hypothetical protein